MFGRLAVAALAAGLALPGTAALASDEVVLRRDDDAAEVVVAEYDGDDLTGGSNDGNSGYADSTGYSNDGTGSRVTSVSRDRDRSQGDRTRDWTGDGTNTKKRDWSRNKTNDKSRNDTR